MQEDHTAAAAANAPLQQQMRPRHFSAQFFASTARKTATSLTAVGAAGAESSVAAPSSTSIAAYAVPLVRGGALPDIMRAIQVGGAFVVALATRNPNRGGTTCHFSMSPQPPPGASFTRVARLRLASAPPAMLPHSCSAAVLRRRHLFRPRLNCGCNPVKCDATAWIPLGSLQYYSPAEFARLVEAVVHLNLREAAANLATLLIES